MYSTTRFNPGASLGPGLPGDSLSSSFFHGIKSTCAILRLYLVWRERNFKTHITERAFNLLSQCMKNHWFKFAFTREGTVTKVDSEAIMECLEQVHMFSILASYARHGGYHLGLASLRMAFPEEFAVLSLAQRLLIDSDKPLNILSNSQTKVFGQARS